MLPITSHKSGLTDLIPSFCSANKSRIKGGGNNRDRIQQEKIRLYKRRANKRIWLINDSYNMTHIQFWSWYVNERNTPVSITEDPRSPEKKSHRPKVIKKFQLMTQNIVNHEVVYSVKSILILFQFELDHSRSNGSSRSGKRSNGSTHLKMVWKHFIIYFNNFQIIYYSK